MTDNTKGQEIEHVFCNKLEEARYFTHLNFSEIKHDQLAPLFTCTPWPQMPKDYFWGCWENEDAANVLKLIFDRLSSDVDLHLLPSHKYMLIPGLASIKKKTLPRVFYPLFIDYITFLEFIYVPLGPQFIEKYPHIFTKDVDPRLAEEIQTMLNSMQLSLPNFYRSLEDAKNSRQIMHALYNNLACLMPSSDAILHNDDLFVIFSLCLLGYAAIG